MIPLIKWVGGKRWLVDALRKDMPPFRDYYEPFCGGAALFFALAHDELVLRDPSEPDRGEYIPIEQLREIAGRPMPRFILADANRALIETYDAVRARPDKVIAILQNHQAGHRKNQAKRYEHVKALWNRGSGDRYERAAAFMYLNRTCFNGLWRVNKSGQFNVPMGRYTNPPICDSGLVYGASNVLQLATLEVGSFTLCRAGKGDLVYFDPPYDPISPTANFTSYDVGGFGEHEQRQLARMATGLVNAGAHVIVSNSNTKRVRELYKDFRIRRVKRSGQINSNPGKRGKVAELIITSY